MKNIIPKTLNNLRQSQIVILIDDVTPSVSGYLLTPAESVTPETISSMVNLGRGVILAPLTEGRIRELGLSMMAKSARDGSPDFTVSVEARQGVTTGISAADRAKTLQTIALTKDPKLELVMPGHIFPIRAKSGGVLVRNTPAEAATDLLSMAGLTPVAALCQCLNDAGDLAEMVDLELLSQTSGFPIVRISDVIRKRLASDQLVEKIADTELPTAYAGRFRAIVFRSKCDDAEHLALVKGEIDLLGEDGTQIPILTRVQSEHRIGDLLAPESVLSRDFLIGALKAIEAEGRGIFVYVRHPRQGMLREQVSALAEGKARPGLTSELREFGIGAQILSVLGARRIRLLTNSARDITGLDVFDLEIVERIPFVKAGEVDTLRQNPAEKSLAPHASIN